MAENKDLSFYWNKVSQKLTDVLIDNLLQIYTFINEV